MILAPSWLSPAERADGEHLLTLRAEGIATDADEVSMVDSHGLERSIRILSTLTTERQALARWVHPAGVEFVGHGYPLAADDRTPGAGEPTTRAQISVKATGATGFRPSPAPDARTTSPGRGAEKPGTPRRSPPPRVSDAPRRARTAAAPGLPGRRPPVTAWQERLATAAACAVAVILILQLARGGWT